jgi:hypothetical protein
MSNGLPRLEGGDRVSVGGAYDQTRKEVAVAESHIS